MSRSVVRAVQILELLGSSDKKLSNAQIAKFLSIPKSSLSGIMGDLVSTEIISFDPLGKTYSLGAKVLYLAHQFLHDLDLVRTGEPIARELADLTGESVAIYIQSGMKCQMIVKQDSPQLVLRLLKVGARAPLYAIAPGKVLLAYLPEQEIEHYLASVDFNAFTPHTITDREELEKTLPQIRQDGLAYSDQEFDREVFGIAAPVFNHKKEVIAAFSVVVPQHRKSAAKKKVIIRALQEKTTHLSRLFGYIDS